ncbi:hypothetical protein SAMN05428967_1335 [Phyllobacterium sp. YR620]|uniref:hypothetical protein n=1 Tax=Phyllobacterium sp. YR620 TaxID=1881066 RepID=UPI00088C30B9|nr:hypothetical protein [Phyllobacterium sp. YR620]SDP13651.1 hypothetical protein SAMN05428967_1335 [Phyllobacterium sp. YR620]
MFVEKFITNWFAAAATLGAVAFAMKAGWHWHASTDIITADELASLSDGRNALAETIDASMRQSALLAKGASAASIAAILAACALLARLS